MKGHKREHFLQCLFVLAAPLLRYLALYPRLVAQKKYEKDDDDIDEESRPILKVDTDYKSQ